MIILKLLKIQFKIKKQIEEGDEEIFLVDFDKKVDEEYIKSKREG